MIEGFKSFGEHFKGYEDCYTIIGGTACDILMSEEGLDFRATRDIDMILLAEDRLPEFAALFWEYVKEGEYKCGWKSSKVPQYYRFTEPKSRAYPSMIELFSKRPEFQMEHPEIYRTPLYIGDDISSLSAIMLDDDYYQLMLNGRVIVSGISVLSAEYLIPFKIKAWLDLSQKKAEGTHVNTKDLTKHKRDVFRLYAIVEPSKRIELPEKIRNDVKLFFDKMEEEKIDLSSIDYLEQTKEEIIESLKEMYLLIE